METKKSYESVIQYPLEDEEKSQHDAAHKLESGETNDKAELDLVDHPQLYNRILCGVFFIYAFYMGIKCCKCESFSRVISVSYSVNVNSERGA